MDKRNNNKITNLLLIISIIALVILCYLFYVKLNNVNSSTSSNSNITIEEAKSILKEKIDFVEPYLTKFTNPCGDNPQLDTTIEQKDGMPYYKSDTYASFDDLNNYLLTFMTQEIVNMKQSFKKEYYLDKDGSLYCLMLAGGDSYTYNSEKTKYTINSASDNQITFSVVSYLEGIDDESIRNIEGTMIKENDNWIISEYNVNENQ